MKKALWLGFAGVAALGTACGPTQNNEPPPQNLRAITGQSAALTANQNIKAHADDLAKALKSLQDSKLVQRVFPVRETTPCPPGQPGMPPPDCDSATPTSDLDQTAQAQDFEKWLAEHVFLDANVEANGPGADANHVVFRLQPATVCPKTTDELGHEELDADCVKTLTEVPIRFTASSLAEGDLDLALTIGATHPADFQLHHDLISTTVSLADAKAAVLALAATTDDKPELPETLTGRVKVQLTKNAPENYTASVSILDAVEVGMKAATDPKHFHVAFGARADILKFQLDGTQKSALASIDLGTFDAEAALDLLAHEGDTEECTYPADPSLPPDCVTTHHDPKTGLVSAHVAGVSASGLLTSATDTLALTNLGLGDATSWVKFNGTQIFALDVNANAGRRFDLTVKDTGHGPSFALSPSFTADFVHDLRTLQAQFDDLDGWFVNGHETVSLTGAAQPSVEGIEGSDDAPCDPGSGTCPAPQPKKYLAVKAGTLNLAAEGFATVTVAAPQCLVEKPEQQGENRTHPFQSLQSGSCQ